MITRKPYSTDISDSQWEILKPLIPSQKPGGRPRTVNLREIINSIFYILATGCPWRLMPHDLPPWATVYDYFRMIVILPPSPNLLLFLPLDYLNPVYFENRSFSSSGSRCFLIHRRSRFGEGSSINLSNALPRQSSFKCSGNIPAPNKCSVALP